MKESNKINDFEIGIKLPEILLPKKDIDLSKWSVVACDQYTSQPEYWKEVAELVGNSPSTLKLTLPEIYLEDENVADRIENISSAMKDYLDNGILSSQGPGFILIDRKTTHGASRKGLMVALDLEHYDYNKGGKKLIRVTEGTVLERLPPRIQIRKKAPLELPHIMVLIDDPLRTVIEPIAALSEKLEKLYDFELMMKGGHIKGYRVDDKGLISNILHGLEELADLEVCKKKYGTTDSHGSILFAVGDGNHSLAAAKGMWEQLKPQLSDEELLHHPARYALVEIVNVHDEGLAFEPIHRVVFNVSTTQLLDELTEFYGNPYACVGGGGDSGYIRTFSSESIMNEEVNKIRADLPKAHILPFVTSSGYGMAVIENPTSNLEVGTLQNFLDDYLKRSSAMKIDYIHGADVVRNLGSEKGNIGFFLPVMNKTDLFKTVMLDGALPRKTFSMGDAEEKRFYLESRRIR